MSATVEAIYEDGLLRLIHPLAIPEHTRVTITVNAPDSESDSVGDEWLASSEAALMGVWDNADDEVFNELLAQ